MFFLVASITPEKVPEEILFFFPEAQPTILTSSQKTHYSLGEQNNEITFFRSNLFSF